MRAFDHVGANLFVPVTYSSFGMPFIDEGQNVTLCVGEAVWSLDDYAREFMGAASDVLARASASLTPTARALAIVASEFLPDRVALFLPFAQPQVRETTDFNAHA
jgi:hypothetical protein